MKRLLSSVLVLALSLTAMLAQPAAPKKKAPTPPDLDVRLSPMVTEPNSNRPERLRPTAKISSANAATAMGFCNWKPQPTACPPWRSSAITRPKARKLRIAPAA